MGNLTTENARSAKNKTEEEIKKLCDQIRQIAYDIHVFHGQGHLEKVYENVLCHRLSKCGIKVQQHYPITVYDEDGTIIGEYICDLFIEDCLILELKAAKALAPEHEAQIIGYLKSSRIEHGLLLNFGSYKFEIRKFALSATLGSLRSLRLNNHEYTAENAKSAKNKTEEEIKKLCDQIKQIT